MIKHYKPLPPDFSMGNTLAQRIYQLRKFRNLTVKDLAKITRLQEKQVEDIESGLVTWLSASDRQLLARALNIEPALLQDVESRNDEDLSSSEAADENIAQAVLQGKRDLPCPNCGQPLKCSIQNAFDIEGNKTQYAKAYCVLCPYVLQV